MFNPLFLFSKWIQADPNPEALKLQKKLREHDRLCTIYTKKIEENIATLLQLNMEFNKEWMDQLKKEHELLSENTKKEVPFLPENYDRIAHYCGMYDGWLDSVVSNLRDKIIHYDSKLEIHKKEFNYYSEKREFYREKVKAILCPNNM